MKWIRTLGLIAAPAVITIGFAAPAAHAGTPENPTASGCTLTVLQTEPNSQLDDAWAKFGDRAGVGEWAGADGTYSVELPDGRIAWLFNDTFLGPTAADRSIPVQGPVHNTIVTTNGTNGKPAETVFNGTPEAPLPLVGPAGGSEPWYWNADGIVDNGKLYVFEAQQQAAGAGHWGFEWIGTDLAALSLDDYSLESLTPTYDGYGVSWGTELLPVGDEIYVYGVGAAGIGKDLYIAKAQRGALDGQWEFFTGDGWSKVEADAEPVVGNVGSNFGVAEVQGQYALVTTDSFLGSKIYLHLSPTPYGFAGTERIEIYDTPEGQPEYDAHLEGDVYTYNIAAHPSLSKKNELVFSYNMNNTSFDELVGNIDFNRARFLTIEFANLPSSCK